MMCRRGREEMKLSLFIPLTLALSLQGRGDKIEVRAVWDAQAEVFYSESDIEGLHIEAATLDEFEAIMLDVAPELIMVNHRA